MTNNFDMVKNYGYDDEEIIFNHNDFNICKQKCDDLAKHAKPHEQYAVYPSDSMITKGEHMATITLLVDKTVSYIQEIEVTQTEHDRIQQMGEQEQRKHLISLFDEEHAEVNSVDVAIDCYDFE